MDVAPQPDLIDAAAAVKEEAVKEEAVTSVPEAEQAPAAPAKGGLPRVAQLLKKICPSLAVVQSACYEVESRSF